MQRRPPHVRLRVRVVVVLRHQVAHRSEVVALGGIQERVLLGDAGGGTSPRADGGLGLCLCLALALGLGLGLHLGREHLGLGLQRKRLDLGLGRRDLCLRLRQRCLGLRCRLCGRRLPLLGDVKGLPKGRLLLRRELGVAIHRLGPAGLGDHVRGLLHGDAAEVPPVEGPVAPDVDHGTEAQVALLDFHLASLAARHLRLRRLHAVRHARHGDPRPLGAPDAP
mmetsp:Transcript_75774/g.212413  ORF Transcript_75774/g.212413 Transcript_75774/m.212413 type:complete len:223 (+) Transcript_75774:278-946(+)